METFKQYINEDAFTQEEKEALKKIRKITSKKGIDVRKASKALKKKTDVYGYKFVAEIPIFPYDDDGTPGYSKYSSEDMKNMLAGYISNMYAMGDKGYKILVGDRFNVYMKTIHSRTITRECYFFFNLIEN